MKASIIYYPNTNKKMKKTGKIPMYARILLNGKAEIRLSAEVTTNELLKWDPMTMRFADRNFHINQLLNSLDNKFQEFIILNSTSLSKYNARLVLNHVMGNNEVKQTYVINYIDQYFQKVIQANESICSGTVRNYKKSINHLKTFLAKENKIGLLISELNNSIVMEFKDYLLSSSPDLIKKGMSEVSAAYIIKKFRTIFDRAVNENLLEKNPFKSIKLKTKSPRRERLTIYQIKDLWTLDFSNFPIQKIYADIFLFSVLTGLAYSDAMNLKYSHLHKRKDGNTKLTIKRGKTDILTESFLVHQASIIIETYRNLPENQIQNIVLPRRSNKELNVQLKILAEMAGIPFKLTSHIARHSFRQMLAEAGIEDQGVIKRMMGQSRNGDIDEVYYSVTESRLLDAKAKFEEYLNKNLW